MAHSDYIPCCKCDVKLIYDGDRSQRNWWVERFGKEPEIECPNCKKEWVGLTDDDLTCLFLSAEGERVAKYIETLLKEKNA